MFKHLIFLTCVLLATLTLNAQVPQALNYQAIARNTDGTIIPGQPVGIRFTILEGSVSGTSIYQETHQTVTNNFGLFFLSIGQGTPVNGTFASIDWGTVSDKFLKVEIAPQGGSNYTIQGTTQFLSVPYALYAEKTKLNAGNGIVITNGNTISATGSNYVAGTGISITGNVISGNYVGGNGINITGNTVSANYVGGIGINITGNTVSGNYVGGNGINITGNTIIGNYTAGPGITISGSTISAATPPQLWVADANGIHNTNASGHVGIGVNSSNIHALNVAMMDNTLSGVATAKFTTNDAWQTNIWLRNTSNDLDYNIVAGGSGNIQPNYGIGPGGFGIVNASNNSTIPFRITFDNKVGIGNSRGGSDNIPKARLHVSEGDVYIDQVSSGVIMKSPNGQCWRMTVSNAGTPVFTSIACP